MATEGVAHGGKHFSGKLRFAARREALEQRGGQNRGRNARFDCSLERPAPLAGIRDPAIVAFQMRVFLKRFRRQVEQPGADDRTVPPDLGDGWEIEVLHTPGHTANHAAFAERKRNILFSADHVMAWATTIIAPPDGAMSDFMASLDLLASREDRIYYPGHGGPVTSPQKFTRALKAHRRMRESAILARIGKGDRTIPEMVAVIYRDTDRRLHGAAALSALAHLEDLVERGAVVTDGPPSLHGIYERG